MFLRDLLASGKSAATLRSYAVDLLRWWRFLDAVDVAWDRASRAEARDFSCWIQLTVKQRLQTSRPRAARWSSRAPGAPNPVTGKPASGDGYAPSTVAHSETVLRRFYDFHREAGTGPVVNPFPLDPPAAARRAHAHHNPMDEWKPERTGRYRPRCRGGSRGRSRTTGSTSCSRRWARTGTGRWWRSGSPPGRGPSELLGMHQCDVDPGRAADHRGAQGVPGPAAAPGVGGCVRVAAAVSAGAADGSASRGAGPAGLVDAAPPVPAADLSRRAPDVRAGQRLARRGLDAARPAAQRRVPDGPRPAAQPDRRAVGTWSRAPDHDAAVPDAEQGRGHRGRARPSRPPVAARARRPRSRRRDTTRSRWRCCSGGCHDGRREAHGAQEARDRWRGDSGAAAQQPAARNGSRPVPLRRGGRAPPRARRKRCGG